MAEPTTIKGGKVKVLLGNTAQPIVYSAPCGFTQRSVSLSRTLEEVSLPDCDDPDAMNWLGRDATSLSMAISGEGVLAAESLSVWLAAMNSEAPVPVKVTIELPASTITWTGKMQIESIEIGAEDKKRVTMNVSMQSDGKMVQTSA
jgi:predicted secreted protein